MKLNRTEERLFALLRAGLQTASVDTSLFAEVSEQEWRECYKLATEHGVKAIAWDGVKQLPASLRPDIDLRLLWSVKVKQYEETYSHYCRVIDALSRLYSRHGITAVQLKGVGLSACYPIPEHREGGDIDIYTFSADPTRMSDGEANRLANELMRQRGIEVEMEEGGKHSQFVVNQVPIENHRAFINTDRYTLAAKTDPLLRELLQPQVTLLDGKYEILTPSVAFNTLFLPFHAAQHFTYHLSLHHLCDWACLIHRYGLHIPKEMTDRRFPAMIYALTLLANRYLGTSVPVAHGYGKLADDILTEMLHPLFPKEVPTSNKLGILLHKTRRVLHKQRFLKRVFGISVVKEMGRLLLAACLASRSR